MGTWLVETLFAMVLSVGGVLTLVYCAEVLSGACRGNRKD